MSDNYPKQANSQHTHGKPRGNYRIDDRGNPIIPRNYDSSGANSYQQSRDELPNNIYQMRNYHQPFEQDSRKRLVNRNEDREWTQKSVSRQGEVQHNYSRSARSANYHHPEVRNVRTKGELNRWYLDLHQTINRKNAKGLLVGLPTEGRMELLILVLSLYLILFIAAWAIMPFQFVNGLSVSGNSLVPSEAITTSSRLYSTDRLSQVYQQRDAIEKQIIAENPIISSVNFERPAWSTINLAVQEHNIVAVLGSSSTNLSLLSNGKVIEMGENDLGIQSINSQLPKIEGFDQQEQLENLASSLRQIDRNILEMMATIRNTEEINKPKAIEISMKDGNTIRAIMTTLPQKVQVYPNILSELGNNKGVVNFEVGQYFTPYGQNTNSIKLDNN